MSSELKPDKRNSSSTLTLLKTLPFIASSRPSEECPYADCHYVLDIETTHKGTHESNEVIEVAIVAVDMGPSHSIPPVSTVYKRRFKPDSPPQPEAVRLHGLSMEVLKDEAPMTSKDANQIVKLLGERTWAAHNANFDWITLQKQFHRAKVGASPAARKLQDLPPLDTEQMA